MARTSVTSKGRARDASPVDLLALHIGKLLRHPAYRRASIVSPLLLRHLPHGSGYDWNGEAALRERLRHAALDQASLDHLLRNVQAECQRLRQPTER